MNIIDQYIVDHYNEPTTRIAEKLGISSTYVAIRKGKLEEAEVVIKPFVMLTGIQNEMAALIKLIADRKSGWAVDAAKVRLQTLQNIL